MNKQHAKKLEEICTVLLGVLDITEPQAEEPLCRAIAVAEELLREADPASELLPENA